MLLCTVALAAIALGGATTTASRAADESTSSAAASTRTTAAARSAAIRYLRGEIAAYQRATWKWQRLMGEPLTETEGRVLAEMRVADVQKAVALWQRRAARVRRQAQNPPKLGAWLCIHRFEGSWRDSGAPYYGGLQMDLSFQRHYAARLLRSKGTADHWTPLEQIWVAERARRSGRGFYPWPNTARSCGLI
jgi:hypothetical protein